MSEMITRVAAALEQAENEFWAQFPADYGMTDERAPFEVLARAAVEAMPGAVVSGIRNNGSTDVVVNDKVLSPGDEVVYVRK